MTTISEYGEHFREAYAALHGGRPDDPEDTVEREAGESLEEFLTRSRGEALGRFQRRLAALTPPPPLHTAHDILVRLLDRSEEADIALAAQVAAYSCDQFQESIAHSDRLHSLVAESARLDRALILGLQEAESNRSGTLAELGLADIVSPS